MNTNELKHFFAVDLGATSGRTILATLGGGRLQMEEVSRFPNRLIETGGHFYWDIFALYAEIIGGLKAVAARGIAIESVGIDTWGVDFVCVGRDGALLRNPLSYRDPHTFAAIDDYLEHVLSRERVYGITGIQFMNFNSLFQLHAMRRAGNVALEQADALLFTPDALAYMLTGEKVCEYTIASTSQLLDPRTRELSPELLQSVGIGREKFGPMVMPGTPVGVLTPEVQRMTGLGAVPVIAVAGHDTASAVAAVPARDEHFAYLSSGTWSLMGIEAREAIIGQRSYDLNFTNEGGAEGTTRFLKNICGMWLYERCRAEWGNPAHAELQQAAMEAEPFRSIIFADDAAFANPPSMVEAIQQYCRRTAQPVPETQAELCRCIFDSLALRYRQVFQWLREFYAVGRGMKDEGRGMKDEGRGMKDEERGIDVLHIIGGGSLNRHLNQMTADACQVRVLAGPQECTALGNVMLQARAAGLVGDIWQMRHLISETVDLQTYEPRDAEIWDRAFRRYLDIVGDAC